MASDVMPFVFYRYEFYSNFKGVFYRMRRDDSTLFRMTS